MPYTTANMPVGTRKLPVAARAIWKETFNRCHGKSGTEASCSKQAWGAVQNAGYRKDPKTGAWRKA